MAEMGRFGRWMVNRGNARRSRRILDSVEPFVRLNATSRVLELGAGAGALSALVQANYRPARIAVSDFDPRQLRSARSSLSTRFTPLPSSIQFARVDAKTLPFADHAFDCVFAIAMLHHVEASHGEYRERPRALGEIRRVLVPGGVFVYSEFIRTNDVRRTLEQLGFTALLQRRGWRGHELVALRSPA